MARRYGTFTPKRRAALRRAALISAQKRSAKKLVKTRARTRTTYSGGLTYKTTKSRGIIPGHGSVRTDAYRRKNLVGYGYSKTTKKKATIEDLYVHKDYRGKGVSHKILVHQAHAIKGKKVKVTGLRSVGGTKTAQRQKIRGVKVGHVGASKHDSAYVTGLTETAYGFQAAGHQATYKRQQKRALKRRVRGHKISSLSKRI